jgi:hypothetical protein
LLFNSYEFIFLFLPITFFIYFYLNRKKLTEASKAFLVVSSEYKDLTHYGPNINTLMLKYIQKGNGLLTKNNINEYLNNFIKRSLDYDVISVGNKLQKYLKNYTNK